MKPITQVLGVSMKDTLVVTKLPMYPRFQPKLRDNKTRWNLR